MLTVVTIQPTQINESKERADYIVYLALKKWDSPVNKSIVINCSCVLLCYLLQCLAIVTYNVELQIVYIDISHPRGSANNR